MTQEGIKRDYVRKILEPQWQTMQSEQGQHLVYGVLGDLELPYPWETVDILDSADFVHDLRVRPYPWRDVAVVHCVGMLYIFPIEEAASILRETYACLRDGGVLWVSDADRGVSRAGSTYSSQFLAGLLENVGFVDITEENALRVTGRVHAEGLPSMYAYRAVKRVTQ